MQYADIYANNSVSEDTIPRCMLASQHLTSSDKLVYGRIYSLSRRVKGRLPTNKIAEFNKISKDVKGEDLEVYLNKMAIAGVNFVDVCPSQEYLAAATGINIRTVNRTISKLVGLKLIECNSESQDIGFGTYRNTTSRYRINTVALRVMEHDYVKAQAKHRKDVQDQVRRGIPGKNNSADAKTYERLNNPGTDMKVPVTGMVPSLESEVDRQLATDIKAFRNDIETYHHIWENYGKETRPESITGAIPTGAVLEPGNGVQGEAVVTPGI